MCECCAPRPQVYGALRNIAECTVSTAFPIHDGMHVEIMSEDEKNGINWVTVKFTYSPLFYSFPKRFIVRLDAEAAA